jgi:hypothetical protein
MIREFYAILESEKYCFNKNCIICLAVGESR